MRLIADIGATNARFALSAGGGEYHDLRVLACADYPAFADAVRAYLANVAARPDDMVVSIAAPVEGDIIRMTNHGWAFSVSATQRELGLQSLKVVNDFTAVALSVPHLGAADLQMVGTGAMQKGAPIAIIGPGTGLGVAGLVFDAQGAPVVVTAEGGHVTVPVQTAREFAIVEWLLQNKYSHVSAERLVSGKGIVNLYNAICALEGAAATLDDPAEIMRQGIDKTCPHCAEAVDLFCHWLGAVAGNLALSYGAFGGVYIAGGIVPQMGAAFAASRFRDSFAAKGRYRDYLGRIATAVIMHPQPGLLGLTWS